MNAFLCRKASMGQTVRNALLLVLTQGIEDLCEELSLETLKQLLVSSIFGTCLPNYQHFFITFLKFQCHENEFVTKRVINKQQVSQRKVVFSVKAGWQMRFLHSSSVRECVVMRKVMNCTNRATKSLTFIEWSFHSKQDRHKWRIFEDSLHWSVCVAITCTVITSIYKKSN